MKKTKRPPQTNAVSAAEPAGFNWAPLIITVLCVLAALFIAFQVYAPALNGGFVWDDLSLPFFAPDITPDIGRFVRDLRPLLMLSFWVDFRLAPDQTTAQTSGQPEVVRAFAEQL